MTPAGNLQSHGLAVPNPLHLADVKNSLAGPTVEIGPSEAFRGYVAFEFSTAEEYPFVHAAFVDVR